MGGFGRCSKSGVQETNRILFEKRPVLQNTGKKKMKQLSGGMKRRVGLVQAPFK